VGKFATFFSLGISKTLFLYRAIQNYGEHYSNTGEFETTAFLRSLSDFFSIFLLSLMIGAAMGCLTALISFSKINDKLFYLRAVYM